jgi:hypothetical protein
MAGYSIYFPGVGGSNPAHFDRVGLSGIKDNAIFADILQNGPDGGRGLLATWTTGDTATDPHLTMHEAVKWHPAKPDEQRGLPADRFWIGLDMERPMVPHDAARPAREQTDGHLIKLADGNRWLVPSAPRLPSRAALRPDNGRFAFVVAPEFAEFAARANRYAVDMFREMNALEVLHAARPDIDVHADGIEIEIEEGWEHACQALAINYRLSPEIIDAAELLDRGALLRVIMATFDYQMIVESVELKKSPVATLRLPVSAVA